MPTATLFSVILQSVALVVAAGGVGATIIWNRIVNRRRATMDWLLAEQTNEALLKVRSQFLDAVVEGKITTLMSQPGAWYTPETFFLVSTLNRYELIAIGIAEGTIDERIFKRYWRSSLVRDWNRCHAGIVEQRKMLSAPLLFCDFEGLAKRWAREGELVPLPST